MRHGAAAAGVALATLLHGAAAVSLRDQLVTALGGALQATTTNYSCKYDAEDGDRDRFCEPMVNSRGIDIQSRRNGCNCQEICHVWGDPHLAPFYSPCSAYTMNTPGTYTLYMIPKEQGREELHLEAVVGEPRTSSRGSEPVYIVGLKLDDKMFMSVDECYDKNGKAMIGESQTGSRMVQSDAALKRGADPDTRIVWTSTCSERHSAVHLSVTISVEDYNTLNGAGSGLTEGKSTVMFAKDWGVCTDPFKYGSGETDASSELAVSLLEVDDNKLTCKRKSEIKTNQGVDGRECTCNAQCSVFGDPNVHDFLEDPKSTETFKIPGEGTMKSAYEQGRVLYEFTDNFAVFAHMNACEHIEELEILVNKNYAPTLGRKDCTPIGYDPEKEVPLSDFKVFRFNANDLCKTDEDFAAETRKSIVFPSESDTRYYSPAVEGLDFGMYGVLDPSSSSAGAYTSARVSRDTRLKACPVTNSKQTTSEPFQSFLDMGGVRVTMKCHRTRSTKRLESTAFFNVCIERLKLSESTSTFEPTLSRNTYANAEKTLLTSGHCALGKSQIDSAGRTVSTAHRAQDTFQFFTVVNDI